MAALRVLCCRFLNAKPTLAASREQAQRTHRWRVRCSVDTVLQRPCPGFEKISVAFPTYLLLENSPDGHAVMMMKVGGSEARGCRCSDLPRAGTTMY